MNIPSPPFASTALRRQSSPELIDSQDSSGIVEACPHSGTGQFDSNFGNLAHGTWSCWRGPVSCRQSDGVLWTMFSASLSACTQSLRGLLYASQSLRNAHLRSFALGTLLDDEDERVVRTLASCASFSFYTCFRITSRKAKCAATKCTDHFFLRDASVFHPDLQAS